MQAGVGGLSKEEYLARLKQNDLLQAVPYLLLPSFGRGRPWNHLGFAPSARSRLREFIKAHSISLVHVHGVFGWITSVVCRLCWELNIPYVIEPYGAYDLPCLNSHFWPLKYLYHALFTKAEFDSAIAIKVASSREAGYLAQIGTWHPKIFVLPYGVDVPHVLKCQNENSSPNVCYVSRITKKKRPEWVVMACQKVRSTNPELNLTVTIAGSDDGHRRELEGVIAKFSAQAWVRVVDFVQGERKRELFETSSVFVLPSRDESLGAVVLEAMAHGVPVVVTPGVAAHEYVDAAGCGFTVEDSVDAVADGIRRVLQSDRKELGRRGREYVARHLAWPQIARQIEDMYAAAIEKHARKLAGA